MRVIGNRPRDVAGAKERQQKSKVAVQFRNKVAQRAPLASGGASARI